MGRPSLWELLLQLVWDRPWLGYGYGAFWNGDKGKYVHLVVRWFPIQAHNGFPNVLVDFGSIGLLVHFARCGAGVRAHPDGPRGGPRVYARDHFIFCNICYYYDTRTSTYLAFLYMGDVSRGDPSDNLQGDSHLCLPRYIYTRYFVRLCSGALLGSLTALDTGGATVRVVVNNDPSGSAEPTVRRFESLIPNLVYQVEPRRGLATARNRVVAIAASLGSDYLIFVDDDDWVEPSWLLSFVWLAAAGRADILRGPVYPEYDKGTPPWIIAAKFFDPPEHPTGTLIRITGTGNTLIPLAWLCKFDGPFDPWFDLTGGEDWHFFERIHRLGARIVWCARGDRPRADPVEPGQGRMDHQA